MVSPLSVQFRQISKLGYGFALRGMVSPFGVWFRQNVQIRVWFRQTLYFRHKFVQANFGEGKPMLSPLFLGKFDFFLVLRSKKMVKK